MKLILKRGQLLAVAVMFVLLLNSNIYAASSQNLLSPSQQDKVQTLEINSDTELKLLSSTKTQQFISNTRDIVANNGSSLNQIFYRIGSLVQLEPSLASLPTSLKQYWIDQVLSFQNSNGGFGDWQDDRTSVSSTYKAIQILNWTNSLNLLNTTLTASYLDRLRNTLTGGFESHLLDTDSDIYSSYLGVSAHDAMGTIPSNSIELVAMFERAQNLDSNFVNSAEIGGFGKQTNNLKDIYWTSESIITFAAISSLSILADFTGIDTIKAIDFIKSLQKNTGGFANIAPTGTTPNPVENIYYTSDALQILDLLGGSANSTAALDYIRGVEDPNSGGFRISQLSTDVSVQATYYALKALGILNETPINNTKTIEFLLTGHHVDGYGGTPGEDPSLRETFDAVYALNLAGKTPENPTSITDYVLSYLNPDGGFGLTGSYTESTYRAISIFDLLGIPYPNDTLTISFLQGLQRPDGSFAKSSSATTSYVISTYRAVMALELIGVKPINIDTTISYLKSTQNPDGGFGGYIGDVSDVSSTYRAIRALKTLGAEPGDLAGSVRYLQNSQNPDGGFKRSELDTLAPNNFSSAIFSYSAIRGLILLNEEPLNASGLYNFLESLHNADGGYAGYPQHTSDIAPTFTTLWLLRHFNQINRFSLEIPEGVLYVLNGTGFNMSLHGGIGPLRVNSALENSTEKLELETAIGENLLSVDVETMSIGDYTFSVNVTDSLDRFIMGSFDLKITDNSEDIIPPETDDSLLLLILLGIGGLTVASVGVAIIVLKKR